MTEAKMRTCDICDIEKNTNKFRRFQTVCTECESDSNKIILKACNTCGEKKEPTAFYYNRTKCKDCCNAQTRVSNKIQRCVCCQQEKEKGLFRRGQYACKECEENPKAVYDKKCGQCHQLKSSTRFRVNRRKCIDCEQAYGRNYGKSTDTRKNWVANNRERMNELQHNHYEANKKQIRAKEMEKLQVDTHYRMCKTYRASIGTLIRGDTNRNTKLSITRDQYIAWLNFRFTDEMTLDNHGDVWHADHVIPLISVKTKELGNISFQDDDTMTYVFKWYNTAPLCCKANHVKNKHVDKKLMAEHLNRLHSFLTKYQKSLDIELDGDYDVYMINLQFVIDNA